MCMTVTKKSRRKTMFKVFCGHGNNLYNYYRRLPTSEGRTQVGRQLRAASSCYIPQPQVGDNCGEGFIHGFSNLEDARHFAYSHNGTTIVSCRCLGSVWEGTGYSHRDLICRRVVITHVVTTRASTNDTSYFK